MKALWCEQAWLSADGAEGTVQPGVHPAVRAEFDDHGIVRSVSINTVPQPEDLRLEGVVFPAASNAHSHAFHRVLRGRTHHETGTFWTWRQAMYRAAGALTPGLYEELATAVYTEMVAAGWTSVAEFHYLHHRPDGTAYGVNAGDHGHDDHGHNDDGGPHAMERALARAAVRAGIRLTLLDTCYLSSGFGAPVQPGQARFSDGTATAWLTRLNALRRAFAGEFDPAQVSVGAALHSVRAVDERSLAEIARELPSEIPLHIHLSEQPAENSDCLAATGLTPTALLARYGLLSERLTVVHATHLTPEDIRMLGQAGVTVAMCPTTEADLADGIGPARALQDAGATVALGTDQHAVVDPWLEMRALEYGERFGSGQRGRFSPTELLQIAPAGGARAQGRTGPGLAPGQRCDVVAVNPASTRTVGSLPAQLALTATAQDVTAVVVGGELLVRDGTHQRLGDPARLLAAAIQTLDVASATNHAGNAAGTTGRTGR